MGKKTSRNLRPLRGRKIQNKGTRVIVEKRKNSIKINKEVIQCIYIQIQRDFTLHFKIDKRKKAVLSLLDQWWLDPYKSGQYSSAIGVYSGVCWAMEHLHKLKIITQQERASFMPPIMNLNEKNDKVIRFWNPKHAVGKKVWKEILEFTENIKNSSEDEVEKIIDLCKSNSIKEVNKSLVKS